MDKKLLRKYFRNQCSIEEIEEVLEWFQTKDAKEYLENSLDNDMKFYANEEKQFLFPDVPSDKMYQVIQRSKFKPKLHAHKKRNYWKIKTAVVLLIVSVLSVTSYFIVQHEEELADAEPEITYRTISTQADQNRLITLNEGTRVRLNSNSSIEIPQQFSETERTVTLTGEAWFDIATDEERPFYIHADEASIRVLGTQFNVKVDPHSRNVQIAVAEGRVALNKETEQNGRSAILTENTFAEYNFETDEILIENSPVENYLSWISGRLYFYNEPLWVVSRYIERLYNVSIHFDDEPHKELLLSTNMAKEDVTTVLDIIAQTLGLGYTFNNDTVYWTDNTNP